MLHLARRTRRWTAGGCIVTLLSAVAVAAPNTILYRGTLITGEQAVAANGIYDLTFGIYAQPTGGQAIVTEQEEDVEIVDGNFSVVLGDDAVFGWMFASAAALYMEVSANLGDGMEAFLPRLELHASPYALNAGNAATLGGVTLSGLARADHAHSAEEIDGLTQVVLGIPEIANALDVIGTDDWHDNREFLDVINQGLGTQSAPHFSALSVSNSLAFSDSTQDPSLVGRISRESNVDGGLRIEAASHNDDKILNEGHTPIFHVDATSNSFTKHEFGTHVKAGITFDVWKKVDGEIVPFEEDDAVWAVNVNGVVGVSLLGAKIAVNKAIETPGSDFAEYFQADEKITDSGLVGLNIKTGKVRNFRGGDPLVGIQSQNPAFVGNASGNSDNHVLVGLTGQFANVQGAVEDSGIVYTPDRTWRVGYKLADGRVLLKPKEL